MTTCTLGTPGTIETISTTYIVKFGDAPIRLNCWCWRTEARGEKSLIISVITLQVTQPVGLWPWYLDVTKYKQTDERTHGRTDIGLAIARSKNAKMNMNIIIWSLHSQFLADRTATQYDRQLVSSCCLSVCPSVCDAPHCGSQGWCTGLKVTPACS